MAKMGIHEDHSMVLHSESLLGEGSFCPLRSKLGVSDLLKEMTKDTNTHTHMHTHPPPICTYEHTCTHMQAYTYAHNAYTQTCNTYMYIHAELHVHTCTHRYTHTYTQTDIDTYIYKHTYIHTRRHTHTHTYRVWLPFFLLSFWSESLGPLLPIEGSCGQTT